MKKLCLTIFLLMALLPWTGLMAEVEVKVRNFEFSPRDITIPRGETVKWVWEEGFHTTTSGTGSSDPDAGNLWDEPISSSNTTFSFQFNEEGFFPYYCVPHEFLDMKGTITVEAPGGVGDNNGNGSGALPRAFDVSQNYPNPFNPSTTFSVSIPDGDLMESSLRVYSLRGTRVKTIYVDGKSDTGETLPSGIYLYRLEYNDQAITKKMTLLK
jgi:plastocyanin